MSKRKFPQNQIDITNNYNQKNSNNISPYFSTKNESAIKNDSNLKKLYLPSISRKADQREPSSTIKLVKSQSQQNIRIPINEDQLKYTLNCEREKLMIAKLALSRLEIRINELNANYKKLLNERDDNIKMIGEIIKNNPPNNENLVLKIRYFLEEYNKHNKRIMNTSYYDSIRYTLEDKNNKDDDIKNTTRQHLATIKVGVSQINALNDRKKTIINNNINNDLDIIKEKKVEQKNINNNEENKKNNILEKNKEDNNNIIVKKEEEKILKNKIEINKNNEEKKKNEEEIKKLEILDDKIKEVKTKESNSKDKKKKKDNKKEGKNTDNEDKNNKEKNNIDKNKEEDFKGEKNVDNKNTEDKNKEEKNKKEKDKIKDDENNKETKKEEKKKKGDKKKKEEKMKKDNENKEEKNADNKNTEDKNKEEKKKSEKKKKDKDNENIKGEKITDTKNKEEKDKKDKNKSVKFKEEKIENNKNKDDKDNKSKDDKNKDGNNKDDKNKEAKKKEKKNKKDKKKDKDKEENVHHGMIEEFKIDENNSIDLINKKEDDINKLINIQDLSNELREENNIIKINNLNINNNNNINNTSFNNNPNLNHSLEEQMNFKEIIEEVKDEDDYYREQSCIFGKSTVYSKVYNKMKIKSELSHLKHRIINIQQKLRTKDDEIEDIKAKATMKNIIFKSNMLNKKMIKLQKLKSKNQEIEYTSIPLIKLEKGNLKNELEYQSKKHQSFISENKFAEENYIKVKNEFEENNKTFSRLEIKNDRLKYKYNSLRLKDVKKQIDLENLRKKINQIENMKLMLENDKKVRDEKRQEIEDTKKALEDKNEEYKNIVENKDKKYQEMNKLEREFHQKINKHKNEVTKIQKEIKDIDKNILLEIDKYEHLTKNDKKFINLTFIYKIKNQIEFKDCLNKIEEEINAISEEKKVTRFKNLKKGGIEKFYRISKIKKKEPKKEEILFNEDIHVLDEKLEYFINSKGELEKIKDVQNEEEKKEEKKEEEKKEEKKEEEKKKEIKEEKKEEKKEDVKKEIKEERKEDVKTEEKKDEKKEEKKEEKKVEKREETKGEKKIKEKIEEKIEEDKISKKSKKKVGITFEKKETKEDSKRKKKGILKKSKTKTLEEANTIYDLISN